ncbi:MAG TPA: hypothetical protein VGK73_21180 [Polyangiaceae bacterium]
MTERAGILVRAGGELGFVPATVAKGLVRSPIASPVASTPLQMALVAGQVLPVVALGSPSAELVLCELDGELVAFSGLEVERSGSFEAADGGVMADGRLLRDLDLASVLRSLDHALEPRLGESP